MLVSQGMQKPFHYGPQAVLGALERINLRSIAFLFTMTLSQMDLRAN